MKKTNNDTRNADIIQTVVLLAILVLLPTLGKAAAAVISTLKF